MGTPQTGQNHWDSLKLAKGSTCRAAVIEPGLKGEDGDSGTGSKGKQGDKGDKGDTGAAGAPGEDGVDGRNGNDGDNWDDNAGSAGGSCAGARRWTRVDAGREGTRTFLVHEREGKGKGKRSRWGEGAAERPAKSAIAIAEGVDEQQSTGSDTGSELREVAVADSDAHSDTTDSRSRSTDQVDDVA
eukprot:g9033.t1